MSVDSEMVSLGGTAPPVPRWLLDAAQRIAQYMDAHSPGDWAIGGIQKRQAAPQKAAPSDDDLFRLYEEGVGFEIKHSRSRIIPLLRALLASYGQPAASAETDREQLMRAIVEAGQSAGIIRSDLETVSVSECLHILECLSKPAASVEPSEQDLAILFSMWGWQTADGREFRFEHFKEMRWRAI